MPTWVAGDLHSRTRLLSVHSRGGRFSPAAALARHLLTSRGEAPASDVAGRGREGAPLCGGSLSEASTSSEVFAFTTGLSEGRFAAKGGVAAHTARLPAYNSNLNIAIFCRGQYWQASAWL